MSKVRKIIIKTSEKVTVIKLRKKTKNNIIKTLPVEVIMKIMEYLDPISVILFGSSCKFIKNLSEDKILWKNIVSVDDFIYLSGMKIWNPRKYYSELLSLTDEQKVLDKKIMINKPYEAGYIIKKYSIVPSSLFLEKAIMTLDVNILYYMLDIAEMDAYGTVINMEISRRTI